MPVFPIARKYSGIIPRRISRIQRVIQAIGITVEIQRGERILKVGIGTEKLSHDGVVCSSIPAFTEVSAGRHVY
jgi:hypothetical protein